ncbi:type A von Willebrand factor domain-containing protein [Dictyostelium discoideum AX4]|uniref:Integrin beta-like protein B n=1 Tax=Dictyostelium discoideum TaxID=44689 RepID=SIBB_DICDI|nr:type A von Willebrand factor domain-containing protein [Dictyostelium discoideum AX4]Q54JE1.1 RecName: Full=Integrin beta-like protein B; Flags: Precursor [Dictyostelium discoideum]EAL63396.1 type A von Willebrand factor domain-containing protein [Dictyostelium discoideum AX4]|eukprot:XP_636909.1 type A von Willebrand factor domain-containing protein [Dictyostelium discoideum AX4]
MKNIIKYLFIFLCFLIITEATHFRYGTISWAPTTKYNNIKITVNLAFRTGYWGSVAIGQQISHGNIDFGDNTKTGLTMTVTSKDTDNEWFTATWSGIHEYSPQPTAQTKNYIVVYKDCCRISTLLNNGDQYWHISAGIQIDSSNAFPNVNWSPVTNMMPIVRVIANKNNNFRIIANDQNKQTALSYKFTDTWTMDQPPGMTVDSINGNCWFLPTKEGLYSTQIKVTDALGAYVVVDFLLQTYTEVGKCDPTCSNADASCTSNSQCTKCSNTGSNSINTCTNIQSPPEFIIPTPKNGETILFPIDKSSEFYLSCKTPYASRTASITTSSIPTELALTTTSTGQTNSIKYSWSPKTSSIGSYVISALCKDSSGLTSEVRSFTIRIEKPECGNGGIKGGDGKCVCIGNWDTIYQCFECKDGFYGDKCTVLPPCKNGVPNGGVNGDGKCLCNNGWTGSDCSVSNSQSCGSMTSSILSSSNAVSSYLNPIKAQVYLANDKKFDFPLVLSIPSTLSKLDVYLLVDANMNSAATFLNIYNGMDNFISSVKKFAEDTQFGLGIFSDYPSNSITFQPNSNIGSDISSAIREFKPSSYSSSSNGNSLLAATQASSAQVGWNSGSFKVIVIITDIDYQANPTEKSSFTNSLIDKSVVPVVIGFGSPIPNWGASISSNGFGYTVQSAITSGDWSTKAAAGIKAVSSKLVYKSGEMANGKSLVTSLPIGETITQSTQKTVTISLLKPATTNIESPVAKVSVMGYGQTVISINSNRQPTVSNSGFSVDQNSFATFKLTGSDADLNILTFKFTSFLDSTAGIITSSSGVDVSTQTNTFYSSTEVFKFTPKKNYIATSSISFIANDGCVDSTAATITITINRINQAPECQPITINALLNQQVGISLSASDFEDVASKIAIFVSNPSPLTVYGSFNYQDKPITTTTTINNPWQLTFKQIVNPPSAISVGVPFKSRDSASLYSKECLITVNFVHTNEAPISSSLSPVPVNPRDKTTITLTSTDYDSTSATFNIKSFTTGTDGKGTFYICPQLGDCSCTTTQIKLQKNYVSSAVSYSTNIANLGICFSNDQSSQITDYASVTFTSTDNQGLESLPVTVNINVVGTRPNSPPTIISIPKYSVFQDYKDYDKSSKIIDGTDTDQDDYDKSQGVNNLIAVITEKPKKGTLYLKNDGSVASNSPAPMEIYYVPNPGTFGDDTYSYKVIDTLQASSTIATTTVSVIQINHKPSVSADSYSFTSQDVQFEKSLVTSDFDGDQVNCQVIALPNQISMYDSEGILITQVPAKLSKNSYSFRLLDPSLIIPSPFSNVQSQFTVNCLDVTSKTDPFGPLQSDDLIVNVGYIYINTPPKTKTLTVQLDQDTSKAFTFNGDDIETPTSDLKVKIFSLPTNGRLSNQYGYLNGTSISSRTYYLNELTYTPNAGLSNWDTEDNNSPLDKISYAVLDKGGLSSETDLVYFSVRPRNPPIYTGKDEINVLQNTRYPLTIIGEIGNGGSSVAISVVSFTGNGTLYETFNMGSEGTIDRQISSYPVNRSDSLVGSYFYAYKPPHNQYGDDFDTITFVLIDGDLVSKIYTVTVNVIHVNQPPTIKLISYKVLGGSGKEIEFGSNSTVNMNINTMALVKYIGNDIDKDQVGPLGSKVLNIPLTGTIYKFNNETTPLGAIIKDKNLNIERNDDGFYYFVFVPIKGSTGQGYARVPLIVIDDGGLVSPSESVDFNVNNINIPPVITIDKEKRSYSLLTNLTISATKITFDDPDSKNNDVSITISIVGEKDETVVPFSNVSFTVTTGKATCKPDSTLSSITCVGKKSELNKVISKIDIIAKVAGNYRLKVFVDDLGYNSPISIRSSTHLNATDYVTLQISSPEVTTQNSSNKTVLSGAIAGAAAGTALIAAAMWKMLRKAAPPTDAFFDEGAFLGDGVNSNPMYQESKNGGENPLYLASNETL